MKLLSLNICGLGGKSRNHNLRSLLKSLGLDMILIQETMCSSSPALLTISKILPKWEYCAISASGLSGGLLTAWNPLLIKCKAFHTCADILVQASVRGMAIPISVLNVYGPYIDREHFWAMALRGGLLSTPNLVLGGDLNITLYASEIWGKKASSNPLSHYFLSLFDSVGLVDLAPQETGPTWQNGRAGEHGISKRLDRFLISSSLIPSLDVHRVWTHCANLSDHFPICLEWDKNKGYVNYPFKFNHSWLNDPDFID